MKRYLLPLLTVLIVLPTGLESVFQSRPPAPYQPKIAWDMEAWSQKEIDSYVWKYYQTDKKTPHPLKNTVCKMTEIEPTKEEPGRFTCTAPIPSVTGWIRIFGVHPKLGEGYSSEALYIPGTMRKTKS